MAIKKFAEELYAAKQVHDEVGNAYPLHSGITMQEGEFLLNLVKDNSFKSSIEVGCAYGISSLYICEGISENKGKHVIIDPFQQYFHNIGILNLKRSGFDTFELIEEFSEFALPELLKENRKFDFAFIDGWHTFDHTLIDFFYLNRMIEPGGIIAFHDAEMPSTNKLLRYILNYPSYELAGVVKLNEPPKSFRRKVKESVLNKSLLAFSRLIPERNKYELFSGKVLENDEKLKLDSTLVAIKKIKPDERDWRWFFNF